MNKFKAGDQVRDKTTGDFGVVSEQQPELQLFSDHIHIDWTTGKDAGKCLHIHPNDLELVVSEEQDALSIAVKVMIAALEGAGHVITKKS